MRYSHFAVYDSASCVVGSCDEGTDGGTVENGMETEEPAPPGMESDQPAITSQPPGTCIIYICDQKIVVYVHDTTGHTTLTDIQKAAIHCYNPGLSLFRVYQELKSTRVHLSPGSSCGLVAYTCATVYFLYGTYRYLLIGRD